MLVQASASSESQLLSAAARLCTMFESSSGGRPASCGGGRPAEEEWVCWVHGAGAAGALARRQGVSVGCKGEYTHEYNNVSAVVAMDRTCAVIFAAH